MRGRRQAMAQMLAPLLGRMIARALPAAGASLLPGTLLAARPPLQARPLRFPRDHGAHPELRTEWWYLTGQVAAAETGQQGGADPAGGSGHGFQVTFFRSRVDATQGMRSAFAARQLLFAHAAVTDVAAGRLRHDQRIARAGFGVAQASETDTGLQLRDWTLTREAGGAYRTRVEGADFALELQARPTQPVLLQGREGLSRKGPQPAQASYYYSQPQLAVTGRLRTAAGPWREVTGRAWLDHEWSEEILHPEAVGWDWVGMNLADGSALTAFRLRRADGSALWAGGSWRSGASAQSFAPEQVRMQPTRWWPSPATGIRYPVAWTLETPAGRFSVEARVDAQELDSRRSTGTVYWEGLSVLRDASGREVGQGYLELTGYGGRLRM